MAACPYCRATREKLEDVEFNNRQLRRIIDDEELGLIRGLSPMQSRIMRMFATSRTRRVSRDGVYLVILGDRTDGPCSKIIDVTMCQARSRLTRTYGWRPTWKSLHGWGYEIEPKSQAILRELFRMSFVPGYTLDAQISPRLDGAQGHGDRSPTPHDRVATPRYT
jgi:hypothetical protein